MFRASLFGGALAFGGYSWFSATAYTANPKSFNHQALAKDIASLIDDDISIAPTLIRLSWHNSGVYSARSGDASGCPNSAAMRFEPEASHGANAGLANARAKLAAVQAKHAGASHADVWTLAGTVAIAAMDGPVAKWRWGRTDAKSGKEGNQDPNRLPDAAQGAAHIRDVFGRMGFTDREAVALIGAHAVGECHANASGFVGPWTFSKYTFSNEYFVALLKEKWIEDKTGRTKKFQYTDAATKSLMMLPADLAVIQDPAFKKVATEYANDNDLFRKDFAAAWTKLCELGYKAGQLQDCDAIAL